MNTDNTQADGKIQITVSELYQTIGSLTVENGKLYSVIDKLKKDLSESLKDKSTEIEDAKIIS